MDDEQARHEQGRRNPSMEDPDQTQQSGDGPNDVAPIGSLPNELLAMILPSPWTSALVCSRWRDLGDALLERPRNVRARRLYASSALFVLGHLPVAEIYATLQSIVGEPTLAHLLPLLAASDRSDYNEYVYDVWSDKERTIDEAEAAQWIAAHSEIESQFGALWPDTICDRRDMMCDHNHADVRAMGSCVLLSVTARHTHSPAVLRRMALFCSADPNALRKAILVAAAKDHDDVLGALLYIYAQHPTASSWVASGGTYMERNAALDMFSALHVTVGIYASVRCVRVLDVFRSHGSMSSTEIMSPRWSYHARRERYTFGPNGGNDCELRALNRLKTLFNHTLSMRTRYWLSAAITADRPETLEAYVSYRPDDRLPLIFGHTVRMGKPRFCEAIMAMRPETPHAVWTTTIDRLRDDDALFTVEGVRWLAAQAWYSPGDGVLARAISNILNGESPTNPIESPVHDAVDALGIMAHRWTEATRAVLLDEYNQIRASLVTGVLCISDAADKSSLLNTLTGHFERCGVSATLDTAINIL